MHSNGRTTCTATVQREKKISQCVRQRYHNVQVNAHSNGKTIWTVTISLNAYSNNTTMLSHNRTVHSNVTTMCTATILQCSSHNGSVHSNVTMCTATIPQCSSHNTTVHSTVTTMCRATIRQCSSHNRTVHNNVTIMCTAIKPHHNMQRNVPACGLD